MTGIEIVLCTLIIALVLFDVYILFKIRIIAEELELHNRTLIFIIKCLDPNDLKTDSVKKS